MKFKIIKLLAVLFPVCLLQAQDTAQRSYDYHPGDWITYPVTRFAKSVSYGDTYVYFGTDKGISRYNYLTQSWDYPFTVSNGMADDDIRVLALDLPSGILWCATGAGLSYYLPAMQEWRNIPYRQLGIAGITSIGSGDSDLWLESIEGQLYKGNRLGGPFIEASIAEAAEDKIGWQGARQPLLKIPKLFVEGPWDFLDDGYIQDSSLRKFRITGAAKDNFNHLWLATWGLGGSEANQLTMFMNILPFGPWVEEIHAMAWDEAGMWIGGRNFDNSSGGVTFWDMDKGSWEVHEAELTLDFFSDRVSSIVSSGDLVWFGTDRGLVRFNKQKQIYRTYNTRDNLPDNNIISLALQDSILWIGTAKGLSKINLAGEVVEHVYFGPLAMRFIHHIEPEGKFLWVATDRGLYSRNARGQWQLVKSAPGMMMYDVRAVSAYAGQVWAGGDDGVQMLDRKTNEWTGFPVLHFPAGGINTILADDDIVWFGTNNGLLRYNKKEKRWIGYTTADGLKDNNVYWLLLDGDYIWTGTGNGLTRFFWNADYRID